MDRDKAYALGVSPDQVANSLYSAYGTRQTSLIYTPNNEYYVIMELLPQFQNNPGGALASFTFTPVQAN